VATSAAGIRRGANRSFTTKKVPTGVIATPSTLRPLWGTAVTLAGIVSGVGSTPVALEKVDFPFTGPWTEVASTIATPTGTFMLTAPGLQITTRLRVVTRTEIAAVSYVSTVFVKVKVGLKTQRLKGRRVRLEGTTSPAVPGGEVTLQRQTRSGRWALVSRANPSSLPGGRSRYRFTVARQRRAQHYRVHVNPHDGGAHASGTSRTVRVAKR